VNNVSYKVSYIEKKDCCGCSACVNVCPQQCITLDPDYEGFLYPVIDENLCNDCGLCYDICPSIASNLIKKDNYKYKIFASKHNDENTRSNSTSGGAFSALASFVF